MPKSEAHYYAVRNQVPRHLSELDRAARFLYLNRQCFNGVYRTNLAGEFNVPRGTRLGAFPDLPQLMNCANALKNVQLIGCDFQNTVERAEPGDFVYMDPPYAKHSTRRRGEYGYSSFDLPDIPRLTESLRALNSKGSIFLLSYADCTEAAGMVQAWYSKKLRVQRHVAGFQKHRKVVGEILLSNRPLK